LLFGDRVWFYDERTQVRRMAVSTHADRGLVVISFWQADSCTATFRLPLSEASRFVAAIVDGLVEALPPAPTGTPPDQGAPERWWRRALKAFRHTSVSPGLYIVK